MYELKHLKRKLMLRDFKRYEMLMKVTFPRANHVFKVVTGDIEPWERPY
jgi:hypothetical protein